MKSTCSVPSQAANERATQVLAKLAPGFAYDAFRNQLKNNKHVTVALGRAGGMYARDREGSFCVANTFDYSDETPNEELLLTVHLWQKLFPERFRDRPLHHKYPR